MKRRRNRGFTLIEVIVTIVISAVAMVAILPLLGNVFMKSYEPRIWMNEGLALQSAIENLVAGHTNSLGSLKSLVGSPGGTYLGLMVQDNTYIEFSGAQENPTTTTNLLKITLQNTTTGETVTRLFAEPL